MKAIAWVTGVLLAFITGWVQISFRDLHLALLAAMGFGMILSLIDPEKPWRWGLLVGLSPAAAELLLIARGGMVMRGQVEVAFGAVLPAFVGCLGGYSLRKIVGRVFEKVPEEFATKSRRDRAAQNAQSK